MRLLTPLGWTVEVAGKTWYSWPTKQRHLPPAVLRLIVVRPPIKQPIDLVTNVPEKSQLSDTDAEKIYPLRWGIELYYRSFQQTLGHQTLLSRTPHMALTEQTWHVLATWLLHLITAKKLIATGQSPAYWSAAKARDAVRHRLRHTRPHTFPRTGSPFRQSLHTATRDTDQRRSPKQIRNCPRKKKQSPPGPQKLQPATPPERQQAQ